MNNLMSIIILNWNRLEYSRSTIECIIKKTTVPHILILVDNNSAKKTGVKDYLHSITRQNTNAEDVLYVDNFTNLGVSGGRNSGIYAVEQSKYKYNVIFNIDDDVLVPDNYDKKIMEICNKVPKIGLTGVNVENTKYPIKNINGVDVQIKSIGNLGGAALALPYRVFKRVGYYGFGKGTIYGHEDSFLRSKLDILGLISAYIPGKGIHLDKDKDKKYRLAKNNAHRKKSIQLMELSKAVIEMRKTKNIYTPYLDPKGYNPVDKDIFTNDLIMKDRK
jgi:GT2 family glycosyltransferase